MDTGRTAGRKLTGYPSVDRPWLGYYPKELLALRERGKKYRRIIDRLRDVWEDPEEAMINYYDTEIRAGDFFRRVDEAARSLAAMGMKKGSSFVASLESVPEYLELLLASELIGCSVRDYIGDVKTLIGLINSDPETQFYIAPDYISDSEAGEIYEKTNVKTIITVDPLFSRGG